ncbi:MAG: tRNA pseudouridine(13) synthase TruD, partial [Kangiellaceae bacterium]|nr:tRNA pseudouridine(13) synthase TruD [Kangiellaceae bacterium]
MNNTNRWRWPQSTDASVDSASFRAKPQHFVVTEHLSFQPSGDGEHCFLFVEKIGANTSWVAEQLAKHFNIKPFAVGYAGLKDRHAVTRQWFSVHIPGQQNPVELFNGEGYSVLQIERHNKKLKHGAVKFNQFKLLLTNISGEPVSVEQQLNLIKQQGYPNYFGAQRFGRQGSNLDNAVAMLKGEKRVRKNKKSIYLSALRSWFFNQFLAERIEQ